MSKTTNTGVCPTSYGQHADELTITIRGAAFNNLLKIADAMNGVSWCDDDNTPESILRDWVVGDYLDCLADVQEITADIERGIDTGFAGGTPEDEKRKEELRAAFKSAGM